MKNRNEPLGDEALDRALSALARDDELRLADPAIERRVLAEAVAQPSTRWMPAVRFACKFLAALLLTGGTLAATGGWEWVTNWWYSVQVDGERVVGRGSVDAPTEARFTTADGVDVLVTIERSNPNPTSTSTRIEVRESSEGLEESSILEEHHGPITVPSERLAEMSLEGFAPIHTWRTPASKRRALHLISDPNSPGSILVVHEIDSMDEPPVRVIQRTARPIGANGSIRIVERDGGIIEVELDDGYGWALAIVIGATRPPMGAPPSTLVTPSGRVRVDVEGDH